MKNIKKFSVLLIGITVVIFGLVLILLPGPGLLVIFAGRALLATEFAFARSILGKLKKPVDKLRSRTSRKKDSV